MTKTSNEVDKMVMSKHVLFEFHAGTLVVSSGIKC